MTPEERFRELEDLEPGWLDGEGNAISIDTLDLARRLLAKLKEDPAIYPTPEGGVELAWDMGMFSVELKPFEQFEIYAYGQVLTDGEEDE